MIKKMFATVLILLLSWIFSFAADDQLPDNEKDARKIIKELSRIMTLSDIRSEQVMSVCREDGTVRQYRLKIMTSGNDKVFAEIVAPQQFKGRQFLRLGDTVWAYFPGVSSSRQGQSKRRVKTAIRISGKETFMGGDFTNNDVLRLNMVDDYIPVIVEDLPDQYGLKLKGRDMSVTYPTIRLWVRKDDFQPIRAEYYTLSDDLIKSIFYQDYRDFGNGFVRPGMLEMKSAVLPKAKTFLEIIYLTRNADNPAKRFRKTNLGR